MAAASDVPDIDPVDDIVQKVGELSEYHRQSLRHDASPDRTIREIYILILELFLH